MSKYMILIRHFMVRLTNNELVSFQDERQDMLAAEFAMLTIGGGLLAHLVFGKFLLLHSSVKITSTWTEHSYFLGYIMAMTGLVSLMVWDHFFLDRADFQNLAALPLSMRTLFIVKFISTLLFVLVIGIALNLFSSVVVYFYLVEKLLVLPLQFLLAHVVSSFLAVFFMAFAVAAIQGIAMRLCKPPLYRRVKVWMQVLFLLVFVSVFVWNPGVYPLLPELKATGSFLIYLFPPCWFSALNEWLAGSPDPFYFPQVGLAIAAMLVAMLLYGATIPGSLKLHLQSFEGQKNRGRVTSKPGKLRIRLKGLVFRDSIHLGIFNFTLHTLRRSRRHQFYLVLALSLSLALALARFSLLSFPFILGICLLAGFRILVELPVFPSANFLEYCLLVFYMGAGLFFWGLKRRERKFARSGLVFCQETQPIMLSLNLSQ